MSLKTLISVSGRLTGDPSSCQKNLYFIFKRVQSRLSRHFTSVPIRFKHTINRKV